MASGLLDFSNSDTSPHCLSRIISDAPAGGVVQDIGHYL